MWKWFLVNNRRCSGINKRVIWIVGAMRERHDNEIPLGEVLALKLVLKNETCSCFQGKSIATEKCEIPENNRTIWIDEYK